MPIHIKVTNTTDQPSTIGAAVARQRDITRAELDSAAAFGKADPMEDIGAPVTWGP